MMPKVDMNVDGGVPYEKREHDLENILHHEQSDKLPFLSLDFNNENEMIGSCIHDYVSHKILGLDPTFNFKLPEKINKIVHKCGETILNEFVNKYVEQILGVEANLYHPDDRSKKLRVDLLAYCKEPYDDCSGGWGPTCIIDWKYLGVGKKFYFNNYSDKMCLYAQAYNKQQESGGPFISHLLVVAVNSRGKISRIENYNEYYDRERFVELRNTEGKLRFKETNFSERIKKYEHG